MFELIRRGRTIAAVAALAVFLPLRAASPAEPPAKTTPAAGQKPAMTEPAPMMTHPVFTVPVTGLTEKNRQSAIDELHTLGKTMDLTLSDVTASVDKKTVSFSFAASHELRRSEVASALAKAGVTVERNATEIPMGSHLVLRGSTKTEDLNQLRKAIETAKLFESFTLNAGKKADEVMVVPVMKAPVKYATLAAEIGKLKSGHSLADFLWVTPAAPKVAPKA